jgi:uncharacterized protein YdaU (DUF1376 family)
MHYFKRNIGDYHKKAGRLTMLQHGAYTLLMDACYDRERFPTLEDAIDWCWASSEDEIAAVKFVLGKFFDLVDGRYQQTRIQEEIDDFHGKSETNRRIALEREEKRRNRQRNVGKEARSVLEASPEKHEPPPNQEPLTINQEPLTKEIPIANAPAAKAVKVDYDPLFEQVWAAYPRKDGSSKRNANKAWSARIKAGADPVTIAEGLDRYAAYCRTNKTEPRYIKTAETFFGPGEHYLGEWPCQPTAMQRTYIDISQMDYTKGVREDGSF